MYRVDGRIGKRLRVKRAASSASRSYQRQIVFLAGFVISLPPSWRDNARAQGRHGKRRPRERVVSAHRLSTASSTRIFSQAWLFGNRRIILESDDRTLPGTSSRSGGVRRRYEDAFSSARLSRRPRKHPLTVVNGTKDPMQFESRILMDGLSMMRQLGVISE